MENSKIGFSIFGIFVIAIIIGGFYFMKQSDNKENTNTFNKESVKEKEIDIRLDNTKDYIYFTDSDVFSEELNIDYRTINFNFDDKNNIAEKLNNENDKLKATLKIDNDLDDDDQYNKLESAKYNIYEVYMFDKYISLVIDYYEFDRDDIISYLYSKTYVFDKNTGSLITEDDLLKEFNLSKSDALDKIKDYVKDQDILKDDIELDADATISNIDELAVYVDKIGRLTVSVVVKNNQKDYNENIIIN